MCSYWIDLKNWIEIQEKTCVNYDVSWAFRFVLNHMDVIEHKTQTNEVKK